MSVRCTCERDEAWLGKEMLRTTLTAPVSPNERTMMTSATTISWRSVGRGSIEHLTPHVSSKDVLQSS